MSDWADKAVAAEARQGHSHVDPLKGVDIEVQYRLIKMELCKFSPTIQKLIIERRELRQWKI